VARGGATIRHAPTAGGLAFVASTLVAGFVASRAPTGSALAAGAVAAIAALARWPALLWVAGLAVSLLVFELVWTTTALTLGGLEVRLPEVVVVLLVAAAAAGGLDAFRASPRSTRIAVAAGAAFVVLVAAGMYRSLGSVGLEAALQARHLLPLGAVVVLPLAARFRALSAETVATILSVGLIALSARSLLLLVSGHEARHIPGVQRIFQTWEPFLAAALGLALLGYVLHAEQPRLWHRLGVFATGVPVVFSFFRTAWVLYAIGAGVLLLHARNRRAATIGLMAIAGLAGLALVLQPGLHAGDGYASQVGSRLGELTTTLDPYRSAELGAVWDEIRRAPIVGSGFGTEYFGEWTIYRSWSHNAYQWIWWRLGIIGLVAFLVCLAACAGSGIRAARRLEGGERGLAAGMVAALGFTAIAANVHENFESYQTNLVFALVLSYLLVLGTWAQEQRSP
jgi:O-antigen ligase